ncbi:MAG: radical SAM protein [Phycisphaeraceae bacterium]|nr:MAG: radical SAM protein [Phycisphaeraceae bacterium]
MTLAPPRLDGPNRPPTTSPALRGVRRDRRLDGIREKVDRGERLTLEDGALLLSTPDLWSVLEMADAVRRRLHGNAGYYNINRHLNYSNVCALSCKFCEFYAKKDDPKAYTRDTAYIREEVRKAVEGGATEMHSVGGLHPYLPWSYYPELVATIRETARSMGSDLHVKAFTAVEIVHLARIAKVYKGANVPGEEGRRLRREGIRWVLTELKKAGLGSLPGGGAEVFDDRVHDEAFKGKIRSDVWLDVHTIAHELGLNTNATMLYGHVENPGDRLVHMDMLRRAQDQALARLGYRGVATPLNAGDRPSHLPSSRPSVPTDRSDHGDDDLATSEGGHLGYRGDEHAAPAITLTRPGTPLPEHVAFTHGDAVEHGYYQTIIPLPFIPDGSELEHLPGPGGLENLRTVAVCRLMLDNVPHVKAFWIMQTLPMAQLMLQHGADDLDGTVVWYDITHVGGASTHQEVDVWTLRKAIREAGFEPVERDTVYRRVRRDGNRWTPVSTAATAPGTPSC